MLATILKTCASASNAVPIDFIFTRSADGTARKYSAVDLSYLGSVSYGSGGYSGLAYGGGYLYVGGNDVDCTVRRVNPSTMGVDRTTVLPRGTIGIDYYNGFVYVCVDGGASGTNGPYKRSSTLAAFSQFLLSGSGPALVPVVGPDSSVYWTLYQIDGVAKNSSLLYQFQDVNGFAAPIIYGTDGYIYYGSSNPVGTVRKITTSGSFVSSSNFHSSGQPQLVAGNDDHFYTCSSDGYVHKIKYSTFSIVASYQFSSGYGTALTFGGNGFIYVASSDYSIVKIRTSSMTAVVTSTQNHTGSITNLVPSRARADILGY
jgi:hypothetical protein